jgi:hypothetical protein
MQRTQPAKADPRQIEVQHRQRKLPRQNVANEKSSDTPKDGGNCADLDWPVEIIGRSDSLCFAKSAIEDPSDPEPGARRQEYCVKRHGVVVSLHRDVNAGRYGDKSAGDGHHVGEGIPLDSSIRHESSPFLEKIGQCVRMDASAQPVRPAGWGHQTVVRASVLDARQPMGRWRVALWSHQGQNVAK